MIRGALAGILLAAGTGGVGAQSPTIAITVTGLAGDSLEEVNPAFVVRATPGAGGEAIRSVTLQVDNAPSFRSPLVEVTEPGGVLSFRLPRPLPHLTPLYWRAIARTSTEFTSEITGPKVSAPWVTLVEPNRPSGSFLGTRRPTFVWRPSPVTSPPGPWRYDVEILNVASREVIRIPGTTDTTVASPVDLQFNTSYRWSVTASLATPDQQRVESSGTFVVIDERTPRTTLLYQNFPNPFPGRTVLRTCIWFDLHADARVTLEVLDLRGNHVRTIIPAPGFGPQLVAGRYGRAEVDGTVGCDPRLAWDGRDDDGRVVHAGVYLLRFRAGRTEAIRKILFRGR